MRDEIDVTSLITCQVSPGGQRIRLSFQDTGGRPATVNFTAGCVQQMVMTLPHLLSTALKAQHRDDSVRAVFPLGEWRLEAAAGSDDLILTLKTTDGFEVAFSISVPVLSQIGSAVENHDAQHNRKRNRLVS